MSDSLTLAQFRVTLPPGDRISPQSLRRLCADGCIPATACESRIERGGSIWYITDAEAARAALAARPGVGNPNFKRADAPAEETK